jgi:hypothetical protein
MWGPCACPAGQTILLGAVQIPPGDVDPDEDKHKAPPFPASTPCPYRTGADGVCHCLIRLSKIIRGGGFYGRPCSPYLVNGRLMKHERE